MAPVLLFDLKRPGLVLAVVAASFGCGTKHATLELSISFSDDALRDRAVRMTAELLEDGCEGETVTSWETARDGTQEFPESVGIGDGTWGIRGRAFDEACLRYAETCVDVTLKTKSVSVDLVLRAVDEEPACFALFCAEGTCLAPSEPLTSWSVEVVDADRASHPTLLIDDADELRIAYWSDSVEAPRIATRGSDADWTSETITIDEPAGFVSSSPLAAAMDGEGRVRWVLAHLNDGELGMSYVDEDSGEWRAEELPAVDSTAHGPLLTFDGLGRAWACFHRETGLGTVFNCRRRESNGAWIWAGGAIGVTSAVAVGPDERGYVAWVRPEDSGAMRIDLQISTPNPEATNEPFLESFYIGEGAREPLPVVVLTSNGDPLVLYGDANSRLVLEEMIVAESDEGFPVAEVALTSDGLAYVAYVLANSELLLAWPVGFAFESVRVAEGASTEGLSLAVDSDGRPYIAYISESDGKLMLAHM